VNDQRSSKLLLLLALNAAIVVYSLSGVAAKAASRFSFLSIEFVLFYGLEVFLLGAYALFWQQILKRLDLALAYSNRGMALFWSMMWSMLFFHETLSVQNAIGAAIVIVGIVVVNRGMALND
jgi:multidrug transporter EmrE-like cation transporter